MLQLLNFIVFLTNGSYRNVSERIAGIEIVPIDLTLKRTLEYNYTNRVLIFDVVTNFMKTMLPLFNIEAIMAFLNQEMVLSIMEGHKACEI